MGTGCLSRR